MKHRLCVLGLLFAFACSEQGGGEAPVSSIVSGEVHFGATEHWTIEVFEVDDTGENRFVAQIESDDGRFELDLGYRSGPIYVRATNDAEDQVSSFTDAVLDARTEVFLTPITHLAAVLVAHEVQIGTPIREAIDRSESLVFGHFAGLAHDRIRPYDVSREPAVSFTDDVAAGFLLAAFRELAKARSIEVGRTEGAIGVGRLLDALSADLSADGVLDGLGDRGAAIELGGRALGSEVVRAELGRALLAFAESEENATAFGRADLLSMAQALASNRSELFPEGMPEPLDDRPPEFRRWFFVRDGAEIGADRPLRGVVDLVVEVADESPVAAIALRTPRAETVMPGAESARFEIDTTSFPDGPATAELSAVDEPGNEGRLPVGFGVDNTPPVLTIDEIGRVGGSTVTISGEATDATGVEVVRAALGEAELGRVGATDGRFSFDVRVACGRRFVLAVEAIDRAGNVAEARREVLCDDTPPVIELLASRFTQERSLVPIHSEDGSTLVFAPGTGGTQELTIDAATAWPIRIEKYLNRLDDLDALGAPGGPNIPRIRFRAIEVDGRPVASAWEALVVEYRYLVEGVERRGWQRLSPIGGVPQYEVPIAYQALGPELATAPASAMHEVEVRVTDEAGLSVARRFAFTMDLLSPPILISACTKSPVLGSFELGLQNLAVLYGNQPESEATVGAIAYPLHLPPGSAAPLSSARVVVGAPQAVTRVIELSEDKHLANPNHPDNNQPGLSCLSGSHSEVERPGGQYLGCFFGPMPPSRSMIRNPQGLNDLDVHTMRVELRRNGGLVVPSADGSYVLLADAPLELRALLVAPRVHFGGVEYGWPTVFTLPNGYQFGLHPVRYRVDASWHEGIERPPYGSFDPPRAYVTRPYLSELEIDVGPTSASVELEGRPDVSVGVQLATACGAPIIHRTVAP